MYGILIDTHCNETNIILYKDKKMIDNFNSNNNSISKILVSEIDKLLKHNNIQYNQLSEVIIVNGPGSFTGVRIGVTVAKTISYVLKIPIKSISSLSIIAASCNQRHNYSVSIPDNKGFYVGEFNINNERIGDFFYLMKDEYQSYQKTHNIVSNNAINWDNIYKECYLVDEDCYNIKPIYIKKIEVEK